MWVEGLVFRLLAYPLEVARDTACLSVLLDLYSAPSSCQGRCREAYDKHHPCHCNDRCLEFGNCCEDFDSLCGGDHGQSAQPQTRPERSRVLAVWSLDPQDQQHLLVLTAETL